MVGKCSVIIMTMINNHSSTLSFKKQSGNGEDEDRIVNIFMTAVEKNCKAGGDVVVIRRDKITGEVVKRVYKGRGDN